MPNLISWLAINSPRRAAAFLTAGALACTLVAILTLGPVWKLYGWLPERALRTDRLRITHQLASRWTDSAPEVLMLGGSQLREALPVDSYISAQLSAACKRDVQVLNAASSSQLSETSRAIGDWFEDDAPTLVVLSINLWRAAEEAISPQMRARALFPLPSSRPRLSGKDENILAFGALARARLGMEFMDAANAMGIGVNDDSLGHGPFVGPQHRYRMPATGPRQRSFEAHYQRLMADEMSDERWAAELDQYRLLALHLMSRGSRVAYFIAPESPRIRRLFVPNESQVLSALNSLPGATPLTLLDLRNASETSEADFADVTHLLASGRRAVWPRVSRWLETLQGCTPGSAPP